MTAGTPVKKVHDIPITRPETPVPALSPAIPAPLFIPVPKTAAPVPERVRVV